MTTQTHELIVRAEEVRPGDLVDLEVAADHLLTIAMCEPDWVSSQLQLAELRDTTQFELATVTAVTLERHLFTGEPLVVLETDMTTVAVPGDMNMTVVADSDAETGAAL